MKRLPTDREILEVIYRRYYNAFAAFSKESPDRETKIYVPIDVAGVASELGVDGDIVFGRLYSYLDQKHGYTRDNGARVSFFSLKIKDDLHCINFPLLGSVLASLQSEHLRYRLATTISFVSLAIAIVALVFSMVAKFWP